MTLTIEGSPETVGVKYKEYLWREPEIIDVVVGTVSVQHLLTPLQQKKIRRELNNHVKAQPFEAYMQRFAKSFKSKAKVV